MWAGSPEPSQGESRCGDWITIFHCFHKNFHVDNLLKVSHILEIGSPFSIIFIEILFIAHHVEMDFSTML